MSADQISGDSAWVGRREPPLTGQALADGLRARALILRAESAQMGTDRYAERRDEHGVLRNRDWLEFLAAEFEALADRIHTP
jgi:hypothetical protein